MSAMDELYAKFEDEFVNNSAITVKDYKKYTDVFVTGKGRDISCILAVLQNMDDSTASDFIELFAENWWFYHDIYITLDSYMPNLVAYVDNFDGFDDPDYPKFNNQISEIEYLFKLAVKDYFEIDDDYPKLSELFINSMEKDGRMMDAFIETYGSPWGNEQLYNCSVLLTEVVHGYIKKFPDDKNVELLMELIRIPKQYLDNLDIEDYIKTIKSMKLTDLAECDEQPYLYYIKNYNNVQLTAVKSFILRLDESCDMDDTEEITLSKSSVKALTKSSGMKKFLRN